MGKVETVPGIPVDMTPEQLKANQQKTVDEKLAIIKQLNDIKTPMSVTVFSHGGPWTIRNVSFWKIFEKGDADLIQWMEKFLTEQK